MGEVGVWRLFQLSLNPACPVNGSANSRSSERMDLSVHLFIHALTCYFRKEFAVGYSKATHTHIKDPGEWFEKKRR